MPRKTYGIRAYLIITEKCFAVFYNARNFCCFGFKEIVLDFTWCFSAPNNRIFKSGIFNRRLLSLACPNLCFCFLYDNGISATMVSMGMCIYHSTNLCVRIYFANSLQKRFSVFFACTRVNQIDFIFCFNSANICFSIKDTNIFCDKCHSFS